MRKFLSLILTICLVASMIVSIPISANAASKTYYAFMEDYAIYSDNFGKEYFSIKFYDNNGDISIYNSEDLLINGIEYSTDINNIGDLENNFPTGIFVEYTISNGNITSLNYDETAEVYTDVTYNPATKKFVGVDINTSSLPVYYKYNDEFVTPTLDENHKYSIEVYDYAVNIISFSALNAFDTINNIEMSSNINSDFLQYIDIYCETLNNESVLVGQLYDSNLNLIDEQESKFREGYKLSFYNLPNANSEYVVKLWLENNNGDVISEIYTKPHTTSYNSVLSGYIMDYVIDENVFGYTFISIKFCDSNGNISIYNSGNIKINDVLYSNTVDRFEYLELDKIISAGAFAKFAINTEEIAVLNFDTEPQVYADALYKVMDAPAAASNTQGAYFVAGTAEIPLGNTPVYYKYNDKFVEPVLDEEHKYNIEVYDYAINITSISPLNTSDDINNIEIESIINSDFSQSIDIYCSATNNESVLAGEIYNSKSQLITTQKSEYNDGYTLTFSGLSGEYTAKLWLEDKSGNIISPTYTKAFKTKNVSFSSGYIMDYATEADRFDCLTFQIKLCDSNGNISIYETENLLVNGVRYSNELNNLDYLYDIVTHGLFADFAISNEEIAVLNFDTESIGIPDFKYEASAEELTVDVIIKNNFDTEKSASVLIATFKSGKLNQVLCVPISMKANRPEEISEKLPNADKADTLKIFIWENSDSISPYNSSITTDIVYEN